MTEPRSIACAALLALGLTACVRPAHATSIEAALSAYRANRVAEAEGMFAVIAADSAASEMDRAAAQRELARIDWLARGETDAAAAALAQASPGPERCHTATLALRVFREANTPETVAAAAQNAVGECTPEGADALRIELARAALTTAQLSPDRRAVALAEAQVDLAALSPIANQSPDGAATRFSVALEARNADAAFAAWRSYFWLTASDVPQAMSAFSGRAEALFNAGLAAAAADADITALLTMLIRAGFTEDAHALVAETGIALRAGADPHWLKVAAFLTFDETVRAATLRANRDMINGGRGRGYEREVRAAIRTLMQANHLSGDWNVALAGAYGFYGMLDDIDGYPGLNAGHIIEDDHVRIEQYGAVGEMRFIALENMISNGYQGWLWDGWAETGGWAPDDPTIVQVRSGYTSGPINALRRARPGPERDRFVAEIERAAPTERTALAATGIASLTSTASRLYLRAVDEIAARTASSDEAFLAEYWRQSVRDLLNHEGRHALDKTVFRGAFPRNDGELEYRAKLSEIALADFPGVAFDRISSTAVGGDTPHGRANARVLTAYKTWIETHAAEIPSYDASAPALTQLYLLSNDQIRAIARDLDPIAH